jgi:hypothetical protein
MQGLTPQATDEKRILEIVQGIKETVLFTWTEDSEEHEGEYDTAQKGNWAEETTIRFQAYAADFYQMISKLNEWPEYIGGRQDGYTDWECMGGDIWYTTQGHGVGFWENDRWSFGGASMDEYCKANSLEECYLGDDGLIY